MSHRAFHNRNTESLNQRYNSHNFCQHQDSLAFYHTLRNCKDDYISKHINSALDILVDSFRLYGPRHLISSYNGGKDADVVMHLLRAVAAKFSFDKGATISPKLVYFAIEDEFSAVVDHIKFTQQLYGLDISKYDGGIVQVRVVYHLFSKFFYDSFNIISQMWL